MSAKENFKEFLQNISTVLKAADASLKLLQTKIPIDFFQEFPSQISQSYINYISNDNDFKTTTVTQRLDEEYYTSVYQLYHDIRLSAFIIIHQLEIGSEHYVDIDRLYKFATEFLLRESYRLNIENIGAKFPETIEESTDFDHLLAQDFIKISTTYTLNNSEAFYISTQNNIPLFSSSNLRSSLDEREITPPDAFSLTQILPQAYVPNFNTFAQIAPTRQPPHTLAQSEILNRFLHPNWYSLPASKWLEGSDLKTFAPLIDEQNSVVTSEDKARLWFAHIGLKNLIDQQALQENENKPSQELDLDATQDASIGVSAVSSQIPRDSEEPEPIGQISLENLYEWEPFNEIEDDEVDAFTNGTELQLVNNLLSELQKKQELRTKSSIDSDKPTLEEKKLYFKISRVLKEIAINAEKLPNLPVSTSIPILQTDYPGTLPVPAQNTNTRKKYKSRR